MYSPAPHAPAGSTCAPSSSGQSNRTNASCTFVLLALLFGAVETNPEYPTAVSTCGMGCKKNAPSAQVCRGWNVRLCVRARFGRNLKGGEPSTSSQDLMEFCSYTEEVPCFCEEPTVPDERSL